MNPFRFWSLENFIKIDMFIGIGQPLFPSHHMSDFHLPIINHIRKMKSWPLITPNYDEIIDWPKRNFSKNFIFEGWRPLDKIIFYSYWVRLFIVDTNFDFFKRKISTFAWILIRAWISLGTETWICHVVFQKTLLNTAIKGNPLALLVGTIFPSMMDRLIRSYSYPL